MQHNHHWQITLLLQLVLDSIFFLLFGGKVGIGCIQGILPNVQFWTKSGGQAFRRPDYSSLWLCYQQLQQAAEEEDLVYSFKILP